MKLENLNIESPVKLAVLNRDNFCCVYCAEHRKNELKLSTLVPPDKGGSINELNLVTVCNNCHQMRGEKIIIPRRMTAGRDDEGWHVFFSAGRWAIKVKSLCISDIQTDMKLTGAGAKNDVLRTYLQSEIRLSQLSEDVETNIEQVTKRYCHPLLPDKNEAGLGGVLRKLHALFAPEFWKRPIPQRTLSGRRQRTKVGGCNGITP